MQAPSVAHDSVRSEGRSRRPASLSIGRTHFSVHPAAVSPDPTSAKHRTAFVSSDELRPAPWSHITAEYTQDAEKKVASRLNEGSPAGSSPAPLSQAAQAAFEAAPRNATFAQLLPILSRLPEGDVDGKDRDRRESGPDYTLERGVPHTHARLPELDEPGRALHAALHAFRPVTADYALGYVSISSNFDTDSAPIAPHPVAPTATAAECPVFTPSRSAKAAAALAVVKRVFNWSELPDLPKDMAGEFYGVAFRSVRKLGSESLNLYEADRMAHEEAVASGGLIMYW